MNEEHDRTEEEDGRERIGRFELMLELDRGLMGPRHASYIWDGPDEGRIVTLHRARVSEKSRAALLKAGSAATVVRDPKVAALLDVLPRDDELLVASEYVDGESLADLMRHSRVRNSPIPAPVALRIVMDVLSGLRSVREQWEKGVAVSGEPMASLLHGGMCPSQIIVAAFGDALITEVGLSGAALRDPDIASEAMAVGHRAPEQLASPPGADQRTDVFQLGIVLWEMLAHRPLFGEVRSTRASDEQREATERRIREEEIPRLDGAARSGPPLAEGVVELVARALDRDPERRFQRVEEFVEAIESLPSGSVASSDQVVVLVERLARTQLEERRAALDVALGGRASVPPESRRVTARPPGPDAAIRVTMPLIVGLPGFSSSESPTARRRPTPATGVKAPSAEEVAEAVAAAQAEDDADADEPEAVPPAEDEEEEVDDERDSDDGSELRAADAAQREGGEERASPAPKSRVGTYLAAVVLVAAAVWWWSSGRTEGPSKAEPPTTPASARVTPARPPATSEPAAPASTTPPVEPSSAPSPAEPSATPPAPTTDATTKPKPAPSRRPAETKPAPSSFRPKGI